MAQEQKVANPTEVKVDPELSLAPERTVSGATALNDGAHVEHISKEAAEMQLKSLYDRLDRWETIKRFKKAVLACTMMCIAAACEGYQIGLNGNIIANLGFIRNVGFEDANGEWQLASDHTALWGALQSLGQMVGMLGLNPISDRIGRKWTLYVVWVILVANTLIETFTRNFRDWAGAKFLAGVGIGAIQATLPVYVTEWSPVNIRGAMIVAYGAWNSIGNFLAPLVLMICEQIDPYDWRTPVLTQYAFLGVMLPIFLWLPETAYYHAAHGEDDKGIKSLRRVNGNVEGYNVELEYAIIKNIIVAENEMREEAGLNDFSPRGILKSFATCLKGVNLKRTVAAAWPAVLGQLTGLSFLNIYSAFFFRQTGFDDPFQISSILSGIGFFAMLTLSWLVDWIGRRRVVLFGGAWCTTMLMLVGVLGQIERSAAADNALIALVCLWSPVNSSINQVGWTFVGEVASQTLRARTGGLAAAMGVVFGLTFNTSVPVMLNADGANLGFTTGFIFMGFGVIGTVVAIFIIPETSKRNPAEIDELYQKGIPPWKMGKYVTDVQKAHQGGQGDDR